MKEKSLIRIAKVVSVIFSPFYLTFWSVAFLLGYNYLKYASWGYRMPLQVYAILLIMVLCFTVVIPLSSINIFRKMCRLSKWQMSHRRYRHLPYLLTLVSYWFCVLLMRNLHVSAYLHGIVMSAFVIQMVCALLNLRWKVSVYMAGIGGLVGLLLAFSFAFNFNPLWCLCILLLLAGVLGTSRMILCQHSLAQIIVGFLVGVGCGFYFVLFY